MAAMIRYLVRHLPALAGAVVLNMATGLAAFGQSADVTSAAQAPSGVPPYDAHLVRLAEIIGSLHYLRSLCKAPDDTDWRQSMQELLDSETEGEAQRRAKLTASYNRGYRAFAAVHTNCSDAAIAAEDLYRHEGETLTAEIVARYGN